MSSPYEIAFEIGKIYDRRTQIHEPFGGSRQSGISPSAKAPAVFIFTGDSGEQFGYTDKYDEFGVFHYTGEGQVGDMLLRGGNKAILEHASNGASLHLFKALGKRAGKSLGQQYMGEFVCADHVWKDGPDRNGATRRIIQFHLLPIDRVNEAVVDEATDTPLPLSLTEARALALKATSSREGSDASTAVRRIYQRNAQVKHYVLLRAAGRCESCRKDAPFIRKDGTPYLEPHHINRLSDGGLDHPKFVGAVCPTCHREIHYGERGAEKNEQLRTYVQRLEDGIWV